MNLPKIHSISKKVFVAILGAFLLIFLLFHACANLCILRNDDGAWYSAFCHFMGTNMIVKVVELVLMACFAFHIILTLWLAITNKIARPVGYHKPSKTKIRTASKLQVWTGILIIACLVLHFMDFYFVKLNIVKGDYMVKTEELSDVLRNDDFVTMQQACAQYGMTPQEFVEGYEYQLKEFSAQLNEEQIKEAEANVENLKALVPVMDFMNKISTDSMLSEDGGWIKHISVEDKEMLEANIEGIEVEPDFYTMARDKFKNTWIAVMYLLFFVIVWFHLRHAFAAAFQTFGLYNYKYGKAIEIASSIYAWAVCLAFTVVVILVYFHIV